MFGGLGVSSVSTGGGGGGGGDCAPRPRSAAQLVVAGVQRLGRELADTGLIRL
ncbi:hypothetical protein ACP4OV_008894 [Aristida adscensionis]